MKLHLYILPAEGNGSDYGAKKAEESFAAEGIQVQVTRTQYDKVSEIEHHYATWYAIMYDNEYLSKDLANALPVILNHEKNNGYIFFKRIKKEIIEPSKPPFDVYVMPKIFRRHVKLQKGLLVPENYEKFEHILDGWVEQWP